MDGGWALMFKTRGQSLNRWNVDRISLLRSLIGKSFPLPNETGSECAVLSGRQLLLTLILGLYEFLSGQLSLLYKVIGWDFVTVGFYFIINILYCI